MKIRSITCFINPGWPLDLPQLESAGKFIAYARAKFESEGYSVQTTRLASIPFPLLIPPDQPGQVIDLATQIEQVAKDSGFDYASIGPVLVDRLELYSIVPQVIAETQNVFVAGMLTTPDRCVSLPAVRAAADVIRRLSVISEDGFANLRFAALANTPPGIPFFPAGYHLPQPNLPVMSFALAIEAADLVVTEMQSQDSLVAVRQALIEQVEREAAKLSDLSRRLGDLYTVHFAGIDFTPAPFPEDELSIGKAVELSGVPAIGLHGSLAVAAFLADTLDRARFQRAGFNGLFFPVHEDAILAKRVAEGLLDIKDLLLYATVCGAGLDTVPLPGSITGGELASILLDVAALALRLDKPLTARLMPVPNKGAGDITEFNFKYFANSRVMGVDAQNLTGLLAQDLDISIQSYTNRNNQSW